MALPAAAMIEMRDTATASNVNAGGFNTGNANFMTDLAATSANGNSPVVTSASYTFVASDDEMWVYIKSGTNWTPGFYSIESVAGGAATLRAAIGQAVQYDSVTDMWRPNTVAGCATVATPASGTYGVDYSQADAAILGPTTDATSTASTNFLSALSTFRKSFIGNYLHLTSGAGTTAGWYEVVNFVDANNLTLDRASGTYTVGVARIGGAMSMNSTLDDDLFEITVPGNIIFAKSGTYAMGEAVAIASDGTAAASIKLYGYATVRGDNPTGATRPLINPAANAFTFGAFWDWRYFRSTSTAASGIALGGANKIIQVKARNLSTTADRSALAASNGCFFQGVEAISYRGRAINTASVTIALLGCYLHASNQAFRTSGTASHIFIEKCIIADNLTDAIVLTAANVGTVHIDNTLVYGAESKRSVGLNLATGSQNTRLTNSILYGLTTGVTHADTQNAGVDDNNDYFNNTTDVTRWQKGLSDVAVDPTFTSAAQVAGTAGKFAAGGLTLQDSTKDFTALGVVASNPPTHYVGITAGTGFTLGFAGITGISTTTNPNDTLTVDITIGTDTTADKVYSISIIGANGFNVGANLASLGFPGVFPNSIGTGYLDLGPLQRQPASASTSPVGQQST